MVISGSGGRVLTYGFGNVVRRDYDKMTTVKLLPGMPAGTRYLSRDVGSDAIYAWKKRPKKFRGTLFFVENSERPGPAGETDYLGELYWPDLRKIPEGSCVKVVPR